MLDDPFTLAFYSYVTVIVKSCEKYVKSAFHASPNQYKLSLLLLLLTIFYTHAP